MSILRLRQFNLGSSFTVYVFFLSSLQGASGDRFQPELDPPKGALWFGKALPSCSSSRIWTLYRRLFMVWPLPASPTSSLVKPFFLPLAVDLAAILSYFQSLTCLILSLNSFPLHKLFAPLGIQPPHCPLRCHSTSILWLKSTTRRSLSRSSALGQVPLLGSHGILYPHGKTYHFVLELYCLHLWLCCALRAGTVLVTIVFPAPRAQNGHSVRICDIDELRMPELPSWIIRLQNYVID